MNLHQLEHFRSLARAMQTEPTDWQWEGKYVSQRMYGITEARAKQCAARFGGEAKQMTAAEAAGWQP